MAPKTTFFILNRDDILPVVQTIIQDDGNYVDIAQTDLYEKIDKTTRWYMFLKYINLLKLTHLIFIYCIKYYSYF